MELERVKQYKEKGFTTVKDLANLFGISYVSMRRAMDYNKIFADREVKRGTKTYYLFDTKRVIQLLAKVGYIPESEQMNEQMIER